MRKRVATLAISVIMGLTAFALPLIAYASDTAQMDVSFTVEQTSTPDPAPTQSGTYIMHIPSSVNLNNEYYTYITWSDYDIDSNQKVVVWIDGDKTFSDDGRFYLYHTDGNTGNYRLQCGIERGVPNTSYNETVNGAGDTLVAEFRNGSPDPTLFGRLIFSYMYHELNPPGTYTGTVYFKIALETV